MTSVIQQLEISEHGHGRPILFLHGEGGSQHQARCVSLLAGAGKVIVPTHPGFGNAPNITDIDTVDDLAYLYLDLLEEWDLQDVVVIGSSLGGWIAAEMGVKSTARIAQLVLAAPVGIKVGDRETRDIPDIFVLSEEEVVQLQFHNPSLAAVDYGALSDDELTAIARNKEATALYVWEPYFHNPKLRQRLHRITVPTLLLWGANDRFVTSGYYGAAYQEAIPGAQLEIIDQAGHCPHIEQPDAFVDRVRSFIS